MKKKIYILIIFILFLVVLPNNSSSQGEYIHREYEWEYGIGTWTWTLDIPKDVFTYFRLKPRTYGDYSEYVLNPEDDTMISQLANSLSNISSQENFNEIEFALCFVQSLKYTEDILTGYDEYPRYPIETLVNEGGDCEDTSILFASFIREMGYGIVLLHLEEDKHMGVGIKISESVVENWSESGRNYGLTYYRIDGIPYAYCETTGDGFRIGEMPSDLKSKTATIITLRDKGGRACEDIKDDRNSRKGIGGIPSFEFAFLIIAIVSVILIMRRNKRN